MHQIQFGYLQVAAVQIISATSSCPVDKYLLLKAASLIVIAAGHDSAAIFAGKGNRPVIGIVANIPDAR